MKHLWRKGDLDDVAAIKNKKRSERQNNAAQWLDAPENFKLKFALETASKCESLIESEQERLAFLLSEAKNDVERNAREFQIEYVERHLARAATLARKRLDYFRSLNTQELIDAELEKVSTDKAHWFEMYAWGYDPRARSPLSVVPFELYPKQQELVEWADNLVFNRRTSGLVEKARDEGATEVFVRWGVFHWRFTSGFSMLLSSRTEDEVDTKKKQGTLFERARFQIRLLPDWMLPEGFDINKDLLPDKLIASPNGNALVGQAPVENMGRGDRVTCALFDEFAFWRFAGYPQFRSMSQTTDSILMPSSVAGKLNQYADLAFDGETAKFTLDWRDNPFKDKRWYDSLPYGYISPKMSKTTIAQEVDRNYDAAQPGKVWQCPEPFVFITQSEMLRPFEEAKMAHRFFDSNGRFIIPEDWRVIRTHDYGKSEGHEWGYLLGAQPRANYPLSDTHFIFISRFLEPTGLLTAQAVAQWREWEYEYGLRDKTGAWIHKPVANYHSHEQKELRKVLLETYGENWIAWDTDYQTGIETIEEWWTPVDLLEPNPFRDEIYGRCKLVFVAPDDEYKLAFNERLLTYFVTTSQTEKGFHQMRKEIGAYHYPMSELGKAKKDMRPAKELDNLIDPLRGYAVNWNRKPADLTEFEKEEEYLPNHLQLRSVLADHEAGEISGREKAHRLDMRNVATAIRNNLAKKQNEKRSRR